MVQLEQMHFLYRQVLKPLYHGCIFRQQKNDLATLTWAATGSKITIKSAGTYMLFYNIALSIRHWNKQCTI